MYCLLPVHVDLVVMETLIIIKTWVHWSYLQYNNRKPHVHTAMGLWDIYAVISQW